MIGVEELPLPMRLDETKTLTDACNEGSWASCVLDRTLLWYPLVLLVAFIGTAAGYTIATARKDEEVNLGAEALGPGGKKLPVTKKKKRRDDDDSDRTRFGPVITPTSKTWLKWTSFAVFLTFLANGVAHFIHVVEELEQAGLPHKGVTGWEESQSMTVYLIGSPNVYLYLFITFFEWRKCPTIAHFITWTLSLAGELTISVCTLIRVSEPQYFKASGGSNEVPTTKWEMVDLIIYIIRVVLMIFLVGIYSAAWAKKPENEADKVEERTSDARAEETTPLLNGARSSYSSQTGREPNGRSVRSSRNGSTVGNTNGAAEAAKDPREPAFYRPKEAPHKTWWEYVRSYKVFFDYQWPRHSRQLKFLYGLCVLLLIAQRIINVFVPLVVGWLTNKLSNHQAPWAMLALFVFLRLTQGQAMLLDALRAFLWVPIAQNSYRALTTAAFEHVHSLSLDFHLGKRTGEVLSALNKGASINNFLEQMTFSVLPMIIDLFFAIFVFCKVFDPTYGAIVSCLTFWYLYLTIRMAQTRADQRRIMSNADREEEAVKNDSITSYETVKYFNAEEMEFTRYRNAISTFQDAERKVTHGVNRMNVIQACVFMLGFSVVLVFGAYQVMNETMGVGSFVTLMTYLNQLQQPLNIFASFYRNIQQSMIAGERLLELFKVKPTVVDAPGAQPLRECQGNIRWKNVAFNYDPKNKALRDLNFECKPGTTTAFVGESGGGKSTVFRLMFRYYNTTSGSIEIDGQDVKDLTIDSVRQYIGVVPQDTTLFNESLMYNLKYARKDATEEEVYEACRAASIHDRIMSFPEQYNTKVGERGMKLSGGERQRVAIARTIIKNPRIIMLDEATSALDAHTEQQIQDRLGHLGQGRTLLIIAHRLSTITHADQIIVLNNGTIAEKGTHEELVSANGRYASMWEKQVQAERAAEKARAANRRAQKLLKKANIVSNKQTDGHSDGYTSLDSSTILPGSSGANSKANTTGGEDSSSSTSSSDTDSLHHDSDHSDHSERN
ncbi:heavy metal tolerance protein precursor [Colletotrichum plurivorum]|uniref:Heavy metal tolerance protein n=1 Tax=Colletotrichum plurivorum TaxID=2175906 RepID=A0A8H6KYN3_9PEZI|nr:heavy metal tolerance protein precursor [Colletotrichum plurivorum]